MVSPECGALIYLKGRDVGLWCPLKCSPSPERDVHWSVPVVNDVAETVCYCCGSALTSELTMCAVGIVSVIDSAVVTW